MLFRIACIHLALIAFCSSSLPASDFHRGTYHRAVEHGFEIWIPRGYSKAQRDIEGIIAFFSGGTLAGYAIDMYKPTRKTIPQYVEHWKAAAAKNMPGNELKIIRNVKAGGNKAIILWFKNLGKSDAYKGSEILHAGIPMAGGKILDIILYAKINRGKQAIEELQWILATFRPIGPDSRDPFLSSQRMDMKTGIYYRPPLGFSEKSGADKNTVYMGVDPEKAMRLELTKREKTSMEDILEEGQGDAKPTAKLWEIPLPDEAGLKGAFYVSGEVGWAQVAVKIRSNVFCSIKCSGKKSSAETLSRIAELVGLHLDYIDVSAANREAGIAIKALNAAVKKKDTAGLDAQIKLLVRYTFLPEVSEVLITILPRLGREKLQVEVARALTARDQPQLSSALLKVARNGKIRKNPTVLSAVLDALGSARSKKAISFLFGHASRGNNRVSAAAIQALGRYSEHRQEVLKKLVKLMTRAEKDSNKSSFAARERWDAIMPAFQEALKNLTGEWFRSAGEATLWMKHRE